MATRSYLPFVNQDLQVESDYGQFYMYDPETQVPVVLPGNDAEDALLLALDEADESRRFLGYRHGLVVFLTPSQYNWRASMRVEVSDRQPASDADEWDHVVESPLPVPSGRLLFQAGGGGTPIETEIPPGTYRARLSGRGFVAGVGEIEGHESYRLQLWPADEAEPLLVKYWEGYELMRPLRHVTRARRVC